MEENFESFLSMLAHGKEKFLVFNDEDSYGNLTIFVAVETKIKTGNENKTNIIFYKFFSTQDEDTGIKNIKYEGIEVENDEFCCNLTSLLNNMS